jgi:hypothetical protein
MSESMGNPHPIDAPLNLISDKAAYGLSAHVKAIKDRSERVDFDFYTIYEDKNDHLVEALDKFIDKFRVPDDLEKSFAEGYTLAYSLLSFQASVDESALPTPTEKTVRLYFKQMPFLYTDIDDFFVRKTEEIELGDTSGHDALQSYLDYYTDELSGLDRCAIVFGFVALHDIIDYHRKMQRTTFRPLGQN